MLKQKTDLESCASLGPLQRVGFEEGVGVWCGMGEAAEVYQACLEVPRSGRLLVVVWPSPLADRGEINSLARMGAEVLIVGKPLAGVEGTRVKWEASAARAVVGSMLRLQPGDALCVLGADEGAHGELRSAICLGFRWRGSWDEVENGEFHRAPRAV